MLTIELINTNIPRLQLKDSVSKALTLVNDFRLTHLPVVENEKYLGLISEDDLLDAEEPRMPIELMQEKTSVIKRPLIESKNKVVTLGFDEAEFKAAYK